MSAWTPGTRIDAWTLEERLGQGAMGVVWRARSAAGEQVAIKTLLPGTSQKAADRFRREGKALSALPPHPNLLRVEASGEALGSLYLVMELAPGGDLEGRLKSGGPLPPAEAARLVASLARGLSQAHRQGILHRDLKPANVLYGADGAPKVADFGLARVDGAEALTRTGDLLGSPAFMAPEQVDQAKTVDERADVYGLGAILYTALTGRPPYVAASVTATITLVLTEPPPAPSSIVPGIPAAIEDECLRALARAPEARHRSALDLAKALEDAARATKGSRRRLRRVALGLVGVAALGGAGAGLALWLRSRPAGPTAGVGPAAPTGPPTLRLDPVRSTTDEKLLAVTGLLGGAATGVEVEVATRQWAVLGPRRIYLEAAPGTVTLNVPLRAGDNVCQLTPVVRGPDGHDRERGGARTIQVTRRGIIPLDELGPRKRPLFKSTRDGSLLVRVDPPAGGFLAGRDGPMKPNLDRPPSPYPEAWRYTGRRVRLSKPYYIGLTEVTWRQLAEHRGDAPTTTRELQRDAKRRLTVRLESHGDLPAFDVDWPTARRYCERHGLRLPTDAEWELAASGGDNRDLTWAVGVAVKGFDPMTMSSKTLVNLSWEFGVDDRSTQEPDEHPFLAPARSYEDGAAPSGCLHLLGNVWEWCVDPWPDPERRWSADEVQDPCATPAEQDLSNEAVERVARGGAWNMSFDYARTWYRDRQRPGDVVRERAFDQGFRVAADVED